MRTCTASNGKLGEGLHCKQWEAGRWPVLQATGSLVRACTASNGKLGEGLYCKQWEAGRGPGNETSIHDCRGGQTLHASIPKMLPVLV